MENRFLNRYENIIKIKIKGKNIDRFLNRLYKSNVELLDIDKINRKEINLKIYLKDYEKVLNLKSIYEIEIINEYGLIKFKNIIKKNKLLIILILFGYFFIMFLTNIVFEVQVIHSNSNIRNLIIKELDKYGVKKYTLKKSFNKLEDISKKILDSNKDKLEWLEIEVNGTKIIVKVEERVLNPEEKTYPKQDIVASKSGIIMSVKSSEGVIVKNTNDYVSKGDVIISGKIMDTYQENIKSIVSAKGRVYAEVWYTVSMEYPLIYSKDTKTGKEKNIYKIQFLNNKISLFDFNKYKNSIDKEKIIFENKLLPFKLLKVKSSEVSRIDNVYTFEEGLIEAEKVAIEKMKAKLDEDEYIIKQKKLNFYQKDSKIVVEIFFSVCERIDLAQEIVEEIKEEEGN
ncbi:MAG: sporulation protein YqfD [Bacilli bacterium]|nr:sporulation protein YqfD [Bacilli bacterium]